VLILAKETGVPGENNLMQVIDNLYHIMLYRTVDHNKQRV